MRAFDAMSKREEVFEPISVDYRFDDMFMLREYYRHSPRISTASRERIPIAFIQRLVLGKKRRCSEIISGLALANAFGRPIRRAYRAWLEKGYLQQ
jgi:hypothetical protein